MRETAGSQDHPPQLRESWSPASRKLNQRVLGAAGGVDPGTSLRWPVRRSDPMSSRPPDQVGLDYGWAACFSRGIDTIVHPMTKPPTSRMRRPAGHELVHTAVPSIHGRNTTHRTASSLSANRSTKNAPHMATIQRNQSVAPIGRCRRSVVGDVLAVMVLHLSPK